MIFSENRFPLFGIMLELAPPAIDPVPARFRAAELNGCSYGEKCA
jgi:hypothetical protein